MKISVDFEGRAESYLDDERGCMNSQEAIAALREEITHNHAQIERLDESNARQREAARTIRAMLKELESSLYTEHSEAYYQRILALLEQTWGVK